MNFAMTFPQGNAGYLPQPNFEVPVNNQSQEFHME
jgi:hypothetical protein